MKRIILIILALALVATASYCVFRPKEQAYTLPFSAEEVASVSVLCFQGESEAIKETQELGNIGQIVARMNRILLSKPIRANTHNPAPGGYGYTFRFCLKDGTQYQCYIKADGWEGAFYADGKWYEMRGFNPRLVWEQLVV